MKTSLLLCLAVLLSAPLSFSADKVVDFPKEAPQLSVTLPDGWQVEFEDGAVMATPSKDDDSVIIEVDEMEAGPDNLDAALKEAKETISEFKNVKYDEIQKGEKDGLIIAVLNAEGEDDNGKAFINLLLLAKPGSKNFVLLSCISSKEGSEKYGKTIVGITGSIKVK